MDRTTAGQGAAVEAPGGLIRDVERVAEVILSSNERIGMECNQLAGVLKVMGDALGIETPTYPLTERGAYPIVSNGRFGEVLEVTRDRIESLEGQINRLSELNVFVAQIAMCLVGTDPREILEQPERNKKPEPVGTDADGLPLYPGDVLNRPTYETDEPDKEATVAYSRDTALSCGGTLSRWIAYFPDSITWANMEQLHLLRRGPNAPKDAPPPVKLPEGERLEGVWQQIDNKGGLFDNGEIA